MQSVLNKRYAALARVSSREQEREGFSLDVQVDSLKKYAERQGGEIVHLVRIAETASKRDERTQFKQLLTYCREHASALDGLLLYKIDRGARNLLDYVELERLESEYDVPIVCVSQPCENTPAGRMQRRTLANVASFFTEQQSVDVREGQERRVLAGLFPAGAPYGYRNLRMDGRGLIEVDPVEAPKVRRALALYAWGNHTLDSLGAALLAEGCHYTEAVPRFPRSKLYDVLRDRSYLGEVRYRGQWFPGKHEPLVDRATFDRVQTLLGGRTYKACQLTYAGGLIHCGHCGHVVTGERVWKRMADGSTQGFVYYRCAQYTRPGHPRCRVPERQLDQQVQALFARMRVGDGQVQSAIVAILRAKALDSQREKGERRDRLNQELARLQKQEDHLLNISLAGEFEPQTVARKNQELRDAKARLRLEVEACDRGADEDADLALKAFELSQHLQEKWLTADYDAKRRILEIVCLNCKLDGATLVPEMRKPFDVLAEGLISTGNRGDWI